MRTELEKKVKWVNGPLLGPFVKPYKRKLRSRFSITNKQTKKSYCRLRVDVRRSHEETKSILNFEAQEQKGPIKMRSEEEGENIILGR